MAEITQGMLAVSRAGHDKDVLYYIVKADKDFVWLSDGKGKPLEAPKKKNVKHVQVIHRECDQTESALTNEMVKRIIKLYLRKER